MKTEAELKQIADNLEQAKQLAKNFKETREYLQQRGKQALVELCLGLTAQLYDATDKIKRLEADLESAKKDS